MTYDEAFKMKFGDLLINADQTALPSDPVILLQGSMRAFGNGAWIAIGNLVGTRDDDQRKDHVQCLNREITNHVELTDAGYISIVSTWKEIEENLRQQLSPTASTFFENLYYQGARYVVNAVRGEGTWFIRERYDAVKLEVSLALGYDRAPDDWRPGMDADDADELNG
jgi:hypothetical protein